jgi:hypothetical protein
MLEGLTKTFIASYAQQLQDDRVNDLGNYTDVSGITHIFVADYEKEYELINGQWVEVSPF